MNWYPRYYGDYMRDTAHLSLAEHGAYTKLLDHYYATGAPIPASLESLHRVCSAMTPDERAAVDAVAEAFFPVNGDGMRHNKRADLELAKEAVIAGKRSAAGVAGAHAKWHGKQHGATDGKRDGKRMANATTSTSTSTELPRPPENYVCTDTGEDARSVPHPKRRKADSIAWTPETRWTGITRDDRAAWATAYPACDLAAQLERANQWLLANPAKARKTAWRRFLTAWLGKAQERGGDVAANRFGTNGRNGRPVEPEPTKPTDVRAFLRGHGLTEAEIDARLAETEGVRA